MATEKVTLSCARIGQPDLADVDRLARIELGVRRGGGELSLADASYDLMVLIDFAGLAGVLRVSLNAARSVARDVKRQAEQREQFGGVEEERELGDPPVL